RLLLNDGFTPTDVLTRRAGAAVDGAYLTIAGPTLDGLTAGGRRFARTLARINPVAATDPAAFYAAQAASVLLDAIPRSDGTRARVLREVRATRVREGLLGPVSFERNGDLAAPPVTVVRVRAGDRSRSDVEQLLHPPVALLRH